MQINRTNSKSIEASRVSRIQKHGCIRYYTVDCLRRKDRKKRYKELLADSEAKINEYLDLKRVIETLDFLQTALDVLLSQR